MSVEILEYDPPRAKPAASRIGNVLFLSGEAGFDSATGTVPDDVSGQARQALANVQSTLIRLGSSLEHLARITIYLTDMADLAAVGAVRQEVLPRNVPSVVVEVAGLAHPSLRIEIEAIAAVPAQAGER